jgi:formylmethanofuran dehydrogenase subunit E
MMNSKEFSELFDQAGERHGHLCPSLYFGVRGALLIRKLAQRQGITSDSVLLEATTKCLKDGVITVLGEDRVTFSNTPGTCRLTWEEGEKKIRVIVREDIRSKMSALKEELEPDTAKFQEQGLALLSQLSDEDLFQVEYYSLNY